VGFRACKITEYSAHYHSVLRPLERLDLKDGELVEIEVKKNPVDQLFGIIKIQNRQWLDEIIECPDLEPL
jgi:predicted DNA-binding antitoxin AbrB/MazE fold protein